MNIETECFKKVVIVIYKEELQMEKELNALLSDPRKKKTLPFRERPFPAVNYFRACLSIQMFLLKLAM